MKIDKNKILVGSDFEMFLVDKKSGKVMSAIPFNTGTKQNPEKLKIPGCCIQRDGVLQECNVPPVRLDESKIFWENCEVVKDYIYEKFAKKAGLEILCCPSATLTEDQLDSEEAKAFGCDPDYNAWLDGEMNEKNIPDGETLRSCGGHIHLSYPGANVETSINLMKVFDMFLTVPFTLIDTDKDRRKLYGKAGAFRLQNWGDSEGFEARTLSNKWIEDADLVDYVFNQLNAMFDHYNEYGTSKVDEFANEIIKAINDSDSETAQKLCEEFGILFILDKVEA